MAKRRNLTSEDMLQLHTSEDECKETDDSTLDSNDDEINHISKISDYKSSNEESLDGFFSKSRIDA